MSRPWMPLWIKDYLADTSNLSAAQSGAYLHLIMFYWQHGSPPPDDNAQLAQIAKMSRGEWRRNRPVIEKLFKSGWRHDRVESELNEAEEKYQKRANAGQAGGTASAKKRKKNSAVDENGDAAPSNDTVAMLPALPPANAEQTPQQPTSNAAPITSTSTSKEKKEDDVDDEGAPDPAAERLAEWKRSDGYRVAKAIAAEVGEGAAYEFEAFGWKGAAKRVSLWLAHGWTEEQIMASVRQQMQRKRSDPPHSINFFEKGIAAHIGRERAAARDPLPKIVTTPKPQETVSVPDGNTNSVTAASGRLVERIQEFSQQDRIRGQASRPDVPLIPAGGCE